MSRGYYLRGASEVTAPRQLVSVIVTSKVTRDELHPDVQEIGFNRAYTAASCYRRGHWEKPYYVEHRTGNALHEWIENWAGDNQRTFVVSPIASDAIVLTKFFQRLREHGCEHVVNRGYTPDPEAGQNDPNIYYVLRDVMRGKPDIISYKIAAKSITWVSGRQYFSADEETLAKDCGFDWTPLTGAAANTIGSSRSPWDRCKLWHRLFEQLCCWWREVGGGPWGYTAGHLGMQFFRRRLRPKSVCTHTDPATRAMEERAIFAGRASTWFIGDIGSPQQRGASLHPPPPKSAYGWIPGPITAIDVNSMYPWLLATRWFPTRWVGCEGAVPIKDARELCTYFGIIADVTMNTEVGEYPCRHDDRIIFPTGTFPTTLTGPELKKAIDEGGVAKVNQLARYEMGCPFQSFAECLLLERQRAKASDRPGWELFVKLLSNAFTGKLAQRGAKWVHRPEVAPEREWGEFFEVDADTQKRRRFKSTEGLVSEYVHDETFGRPMGFCYAYLTAYARLFMRELRALAPVDTVISQDTDGLWVLESAKREIFAARGGESKEPGKLKMDDVQPAGRWFGPKHYWLPSGWILSGFHQAARIGKGLTFEDTFNRNPLHTIATELPTKLVHNVRRGTLDMKMAAGTVDKFGWVRPTEVNL